MKKSSILTPEDAGFRMPAEWQPHASTWLAWPSHGDLWLENLEPARDAFVALCRALAPDVGKPLSFGEMLEILVLDDQAEREARRRLKNIKQFVTFRRIPFGDIWLRDTAPIFLTDDRGRLASTRFDFNGWGEKYVLEHDDMVSSRIAAAAGAPTFSCDMIFEGGSVDVDGEGTALTTRQCLLNPNRNPGMTRAEIEDQLRRYLGLEKILWLDHGLANDHTDGHVDNLARFIGPGVVACMRPSGDDDPNADVIREIMNSLKGFRDAQGRRLEIETIPSPGRVLNPEGEVVSASYMNFFIGNRSVVVPIFGADNDDAALEDLASLFSRHRIVGLNARALISGGGTFHCITQQQPQGGVP